jgi:hypothetical protein
MDQLIQMVQQRTGIDESQARGAVDTVLGFLKDKLPAPIAGQIDGVVSGQGGDSGSPMDQIGGMLGR